MEVEAEAEAILCHFMWNRKRLKKFFLNLEAEAEAIEKKFSVFKVEAEAMKNFSIKWKRKRKLWNFFSQNGSGSGSAIKIYRFQNAVWDINLIFGIQLYHINLLYSEKFFWNRMMRTGPTSLPTENL